jgi:protein-disulfide isomerase
MAAGQPGLPSPNTAMASRTKQKEEARARRLAEEQARAERASRNRRFQLLGGVLVVAIAIVAVAIAVSSGGSSNGNPNKVGGKAKFVSAAAACQAAGATAACDRVNTLLAGIPESGNTLGNSSAPVTVTEFGDLECSVCDAFALPTNVNVSTNGTPGSGFENQLITQYVRTGKVKLVFRSLETATGSGATPGIWAQQQAGVYAAGLQNKAWYYIELFYNEQQPEGTPYTTTFLNGIAKQVPGLNISAWQANLQSPNLQAKVSADNSAGVSADQSAGQQPSTPSLFVDGPKGHAQPIVGLPTGFSQLSTEIRQVS